MINIRSREGKVSHFIRVCRTGKFCCFCGETDDFRFTCRGAVMIVAECFSRFAGALKGK